MTTNKQIYTKDELRIWAKEKRHRADFDVLNKKIVENIRTLDIYKSAKNVMIFYPLADEINLLGLADDGKNFSFPVVFGDEIVSFKKGKKFKKGEFGVFEPVGTEEQEISELDLVLAPALCVDEKGYRVGYGKGYYDRFIKKLNRKRTKLLTPIFDEFVVDSIGAEQFDEKVDFIVTEKRVIGIS